MVAALLRLSKAFVVVAALLCAAILFFRFVILPPPQSDLPAIAHAGGGFEGHTYTNSIAALDASYVRGFRVFEIDFLRTFDGVFVCGHDWDRLGGSRLLAEGFELVRARMDMPSCTLDELLAWFERHPDAVLVSDAKEDVDELNALLSLRLGNRLVAQAYGFDQLCRYRGLGIERAILTLYRMPRSISQLMDGFRGPCVSDGFPEAVTMDVGRVRAGQALFVKAWSGLPVYTHTINSCLLSRALYLLGADQVYTDFLGPDGCDP